MELDLSFNVIQAAGAESLAEVRHFQTPSHRRINPFFPTSLQAITKNNTLTQLNLRNNGLGSIGKVATTALRNCSSSHLVSGAGAGGQALADAMRHNDHIRELCIVDNKVGFDVMTLLAARLRGTARDTLHCVRATELEIPIIHLEKRERDARHKRT